MRGTGKGGDWFPTPDLCLDKENNVTNLWLSENPFGLRKNNKKKMETFDAREIHKQFGNEDWGEYLIQEAHLSQRFVFDQNGYYRCCGSIPFPGEQRAWEESSNQRPQSQISSIFTGFGPVVWALTTLRREPDKIVKLYRSSCVNQIVVFGLVLSWSLFNKPSQNVLVLFLQGNKKVLSTFNRKMIIYSFIRGYWLI